jgi:hypothetical protein
MWQLPARFVGPYADSRTRAPAPILRRQERMIDDQTCGHIYNLETRLPRPREDAAAGVRIDFKHLEYVEDWSIQEQKKELDKVQASITGCRLGSGGRQQGQGPGPPLASQIADIKISRRRQDGLPSIDKDFLAALKHPIANASSGRRRWTSCGTPSAARPRTRSQRPDPLHVQPDASLLRRRGMTTTPAHGTAGSRRPTRTSSSSRPGTRRSGSCGGGSTSRRTASSGRRWTTRSRSPA